MSKNTRKQNPIFDSNHADVAARQKEAIDNDPGLRHRVCRAQGSLLGQSGKGDLYRPVDPEKYRANYDEINWKSKKVKQK